MKSLKKAILLLVLCSFTTIAFAQLDTLTNSTYRHLPDAREKVPLFIINNNIIGALNVNPNDIKAISVFKGADNIPPMLKNLDKYGIIMITLKKGINVPAKSFNDIKQWLGIKTNVKFAVDGFYVDDTRLMVGTQSIYDINIIRDDKGAASTINIWTMAPSSRKGNPPPPPNGKPGEIYIR
jgi:hypothetical protein